MVPMEPSLPWLIASSMATISSPRTSPTITRDGFSRSPALTNSAIPISPWPSTLASRASNATTLGCRSLRPGSCRPNSKAFSMVTSRSSAGTSLSSARSMVVFPTPVPPAMITFLRALTRARKNSARPASMAPSSISCCRNTRTSRCRRIDRQGRWLTSMIANRRLPSGSRRFRRGWARSKRRGTCPSRAPIIWMNDTSASSLGHSGGADVVVPSAYCSQPPSQPL
jgi:hypothetical protein